MTREEFDACSPRLQAFLRGIYSDIQESRDFRRDLGVQGWVQKPDGDWWYRDTTPLPEFDTWLTLPCPRDPTRVA